jgi:hypothetical protein
VLRDHRSHLEHGHQHPSTTHRPKLTTRGRTAVQVGAQDSYEGRKRTFSAGFNRSEEMTSAGGSCGLGASLAPTYPQRPCRRPNQIPFLARVASSAYSLAFLASAFLILTE